MKLRHITSFKAVLLSFIVLSFAVVSLSTSHASAACAAQDTSRGTVTSTFTVPTTGSYRVWSRILAPNTTNNSYILEIDGSTCGVIVGDSAITANTWTWVDYQSGTSTNKINVSLTAGTHTMTLIGREDNVEVDRVILTADTTCVPTGTGDNCASPPDTTVPTTSITAPTNGAIVTGTVAVNATATDDVAISKVEFYVDGVLKSTDTTTAYSYSLDSTTLTNGNHTLYTIAYDTSNNKSLQSANVSITVNNAPKCTAGSTTKPTAPTGLIKSSTNYTTIGLSWTASTASPGCTITGYDVYRNGTKVGSATTNSYTDTGLVADGSYTYYIVANDSGPNASAQSSSVVFTTLADNLAPNIPTSFAATSASAASVSLTWVAPTDLPNPGGSGVAGYYIYRNGAATPTYTVASPTTLSFVDTNVSASTKYTYVISAYDKDANESAPSTSVSATTLAPTCSGTPSVPGGVKSLGATLTTINVGWTASTPSAGCTIAGYHVYRGGTYVGDSTTTSYGDSGLSPNTSYGYTVAAFDTSGHVSAQSASATLATTADTTAPNAPASVTANATGSATVVVNWTAATDNVAVTGYKVYRGGTLVKTASSTTLTFTDSTVSPNTDYVYSVSAFDAANNESTKTVATPNPVHTPAATDTTAPSVPTLPSTPVSAVTAQSASVTWLPSTDNVSVAGYHVYVNGVYSNDTTSTTVALSCLAPGVTYNVTIKAFDTSGNISSAAAVTTATLNGTGGDVDCNHIINSTDLFTLLRNWNSTVALPINGDVTGDAKVNSSDLFALLRNWGKSA